MEDLTLPEIQIERIGSKIHRNARQSNGITLPKFFVCAKLRKRALSDKLGVQTFIGSKKRFRGDKNDNRRHMRERDGE